MFDLPSGFDIELGIELLKATYLSWYAKPALEVDGYTLRGSPLRASETTLIVARDGLNDTEVVTSLSEDGDILVVFRPSEYRFFAGDGAFRDWFFTDFKSHRMIYPPRPGDWPNHTWVHTGFWSSYDLVSAKLHAEVQRLIDLEPGSEKRRLFVTGFSLGGAQAALAAMDLALLSVPTVMYSFAAPRPGDRSLSDLLSARTRSSWAVGYGGDPVIHVPPVGPDLPITLHGVVTIEIGPISVHLGNVPQIGQEYVTPDRILYVTTDSKVLDHLPFGQLALSFGHHNQDVYLAALGYVRQWQYVDPPTPGPKLDISPALHTMLA